MISTLQKLVGIQANATNAHALAVNFNANLPVNVEVLKQMDASRYRLRVGRKELTTKSQKPLCEKETYWGNFSQVQGGILTLSHLWKQPRVFQEKAYFIDAPLEGLIDDAHFSLPVLKQALLDELLAQNIDKTLFTTFSYMLLALSKEVIHLPLLDEGRRTLFQCKPEANDLSFYIAFENLGPIQGIITENHLHLEVMYEKSLYFLEKELPKLDMIATLCLTKEIYPLFDTNELSFDIKG